MRVAVFRFSLELTDSREANMPERRNEVSRCGRIGEDILAHDIWFYNVEFMGVWRRLRALKHVSTTLAAVSSDDCD